MMQRGRKSAASLSVVGPVYGLTRLAPVSTLTDAQRSIWLSIVNSRPAEWFGPEHVPLLEQYCRHKVNADLIESQLREFQPEWLAESEGLKRYDRLLAMLDRETKAINTMARSMRLTQQSTYNAKRANTLENQAKGKQPWQRTQPAEHNVGGGVLPST